MAEMLIDGAKLDACLDAEADAIRAKTGGSTDIAFDYANNKGFADAIAAIPSGGGSLPSVISKIDGGSFTFVADTAIQSNKINHSLGIKPKGYIIWSESVMTDDVAYANQTLMFSYGIGLPWKNAGTTNNVGYSYAMWRRTNGAVSEQNSSSPTITDTQIAPQGFYYWRGGVQYNWLAWA